MKYIICYERNSVYQCIGMNAQTAEQAAAYFAQYKPSARILGISERWRTNPAAPSSRFQMISSKPKRRPLRGARPPGIAARR